MNVMRILKPVISYKRVSTARQGQSGLGLDAQADAISRYLASLSPSPALLAEYIEVESGSRSDRPELVKALAHAARTGATLIIGKLDRLSRDAHFLLGLSKSGIDFVACDMPDASPLTLGIMAVFAEQERRLISERTKAALAQAKARGVRLGSPTKGIHLRALGNAHAVRGLRHKAAKRAQAILPVINDIRATGIVSANGIAKELNRRKVKTARLGRWQARTVIDLLTRASEAEAVVGANATPIVNFARCNRE